MSTDRFVSAKKPTLPTTDADYASLKRGVGVWDRMDVSRAAGKAKASGLKEIELKLVNTKVELASASIDLAAEEVKHRLLLVHIPKIAAMTVAVGKSMTAVDGAITDSAIAEGTSHILKHSKRGRDLQQLQADGAISSTEMESLMNASANLTNGDAARVFERAEGAKATIDALGKGLLNRLAKSNTNL